MICLMDYSEDEVVRTLPCCKRMSDVSALLPQRVYRLLVGKEQEVPGVQDRNRFAVGLRTTVELLN